MRSVVEIKEDFAIDEASRVPYYYQVKKYLKQKIDSGEWKKGQMLPYEKQLCEWLDISRIVVRQAYQELRNEGYIISKKGKGTFISDPKISTNWMQNFTGFYESMKKLGYKVKNDVIRQDLVFPGSKIEKELGLGKEDRVIVIKRVHNINDEPFYLSTCHLPYKLFPDLLEEKVDASIYKVLEKKYRLEIIRSRRFIEGGRANPDEAHLLSVDEGDFVFRVESVSYLENNIPFEYFHSTHIAEQTRLIIDIVKTGSKLQMGKVM